MAYTIVKDTCKSCGRILQDGEKAIFTNVVTLTKSRAGWKKPKDGEVRIKYAARHKEKGLYCLECW